MVSFDCFLWNHCSDYLCGVAVFVQKDFRPPAIERFVSKKFKIPELICSITSRWQTCYDTHMIWRIISAIALIIMVVSFPVILTILFGILFLVIFSNFYEIIPIFFVSDMLYSVPQVHFFGFQYCMTLLAIVLVLISVFFKKYIFEGSFMRA